MVRYLGGGADLAWPAQGITALGIVAIVWLTWRSPLRYALKAATLSAGVLIATPYAFPYDMAAIAIPIAFLAQDQLRWGLLKAEQGVALALFAASFWIIAAGNRAPVGGPILLALLCLILRRRAAFSIDRGHRRVRNRHASITSEVVETLPVGAGPVQRGPRPLGIFAVRRPEASWLHARRRLRRVRCISLPFLCLAVKQSGCAALPRFHLRIRRRWLALHGQVATIYIPAGH